MDNILSDLNRKFNGEATITEFELENILFALNDPMEIWELSDNTGISVDFLINIIDVLKEHELIRISGKKIMLKKRINNDKINFDYSFLIERVSECPIFSQLFINKKSMRKRINYLKKYCCGKKIAIFGDADFTSICLASGKIAENITVFEIDQRVIDKINEINSRENFGIDVISHDLRNKIPINFNNKFDIIFSDMPYSHIATKIYLFHAINLLKEIPGCSIILVISPNLPNHKIELKIQKEITDTGLYIIRKWECCTHKIPLDITKKYSSIEKIKKALNDNNGKDYWYLHSLHRMEFMFHLITTNLTKKIPFKKEMRIYDF